MRLAKLAALAEFAAGAGHEINNPLAVISGQAQYILSHKEDWLASDEEESSHEALGKIIAQTKRIHGILRELMQFARPPPRARPTIDLVAAAARGRRHARRRLRPAGAQLDRPSRASTPSR